MVSDDDTIPPDCAIMKWNVLLLEASVKMGAPINSCLHYKRQLEEAGFVNVVQVEYKWPMNTWPRDENYKNIGIFFLYFFISS